MFLASELEPFIDSVFCYAIDVFELLCDSIVILIDQRSKICEFVHKDVVAINDPVDAQTGFSWFWLLKGIDDGDECHDDRFCHAYLLVQGQRSIALTSET